MTNDRTPKEILFIKDRSIKAAYNDNQDDKDLVDLCLDEAETAVATEPLWDRRNEAVALLAWHNYQLSEHRAAQKANGAVEGKQVVERKLDNGSVKYATGTQRYGEGKHGSTEPGAAYDDLIATRWVLPAFP